MELSDEEWKDYIHALELFNSKYFWECHEVLEDIWMIKQGKVKIFLQGIIQAAAAFYHVLNENPQGVVKLAEGALAKLKPQAPCFLKLEITPLLAGLEKFHQEAVEILNGEKKEFSLALIPLLEIPGAAS